MPNDNVLTEQIRAMCNAHVVTMGDDFALGADRLAKRILALLAAHPGQPEPRAEVKALIAAAETVVSADRACALDDADIDALASAIDAARTGGQ